MEPTQKLIYDRSLTDVQRVAELNRKISAGSASAEEVQEWFSAKGALNYEDLNRIESWTEFLSNQLKSYGYNASITKRAERTYKYYEKPEPGDEPVARLPEGYRELTYIESTGTQYVDTGFKNNQDSRICMDAQVTTQPSGSAWLFGARDSTSVGARNVYLLNGTTWAADYNSSASRVQYSSVGILDRLQIDFNKNVLSINGVTNTFATTQFQCGYTHTLFGANFKGSVSSFVSARLYSCQIYDNSTLVRDFIPCRNPSGDAGLYDLVTKQFFGNAGAGAFVQGEAVVSLPAGYERAHYIESTGTQYIDTGVIPTSENLRIVCVHSLPTSPKGKSLFGVENGSSFSINNYYTTDTNMRFYVGTKASVCNFTVAVDTRYYMDSHANNGTFVLTVDGSTVSNTSYTGSLEKLSLALFGSNIKGTVSQCINAKMYACKIYDNGILVRDYIPCKNASGEYGLYDLVTAEFYGNAGTGVFYGNIARELPAGYTQVDYIQSSGTQYVDTGFKPNQNTRVVMDAQLSNTPTSNVSVLGACKDNNHQVFWVYYRAASSEFAFKFGETSSNYSSVVGTPTKRNVIDINKNVLTIGSNTGTQTFSEFTSNYTAYLLARNNAGSSAELCSAKLYSTQIYDNGAFVRDYVPCVNVQGIAGLYDVANDVFYTNAGTGVFTTGEAIEYIENVGGGSNGSTTTTVTYNDWRVWDIPQPTEINRIRDNVNSLRYGFYNLSDWREIAYKNNPSFEDINTLEWDMQTIYNWLKLMVLNFKYSGEAYAGEAW